ncbi:MAG: MMPL family transporter, partial [Pseudomonadota bacterium]
IDLSLSGTVVTNVVLGEAVASDFTTLIPLTVLTIACGLWLLFASAPAMAVTMLVVLLSVTSTMGVFGWGNTVLASVAGFVPTIVMTIAVADVVHILVSYSHQLRIGNPKRAALVEAMRINLEPVFITSLTTSIGVLGLNFSDSPPYQALGNMVAVGVGFAFVYSIVLVPAVLILLPASWFTRGGREVSGTGRAQRMRAFADWVLARRRLLLIVFAVLLPLSFAGLAGNRLTERWFEYFDMSFEYRRALEIINCDISGVDAIEYSVESGVADGVNNPIYLDDLDRFAAWMREQPNVVNVNSFADIMKRLNRNMHGDDPTWYRLPDNRALAAQYLLLYELSLPQGQGLDSTLDIDRSASRMQVFLTKTDSDELLALEARAREWLADNTSAVTAGNGTGVDVMFAHLNQRNIRAMLKGTAVALALISLVLMVTLRSWRMGVVSMVPNLVPALFAFALWGVTVGEVNLAVSVVITMSLGIVVDDTVHFLSKYLRARRERGWDAPEAIRYAFETVGVALTITTLVLVAGFSLLGFSHFGPTVDTGTLLAVTLALALVVDFLLLPAVLVWVDRRPGGPVAADSRPAPAGADGIG